MCRSHHQPGSVLGVLFNVASAAAERNHESSKFFVDRDSAASASLRPALAIGTDDIIDGDAVVEGAFTACCHLERESATS